MKKIAILILLSSIWISSFAQVPDVTVTNPVPSSGVNINNQSQRWSNLTAYGRFFPPTFANNTAFVAAGGKNLTSIYYNTTIGKLIISKQGGTYDTVAVGSVDLSGYVKLSPSSVQLGNINVSGNIRGGFLGLANAPTTETSPTPQILTRDTTTGEVKALDGTGFASNFIQNQNFGAQTANSWITGTYRSGTVTDYTRMQPDGHYSNTSTDGSFLGASNLSIANAADNIKMQFFKDNFLFVKDGFAQTIKPFQGTITANRNIEFPDASGTVALTTDGIQNQDAVIQTAKFRINGLGTMGGATFNDGTNDAGTIIQPFTFNASLNALPHMVITSTSANAGVRLHLQPKGYIQNGLQAKTDWMFDEFEADPNNYRLFNVLTRTGTTSGLLSTNGVAFLGVKGRGNQQSIYPALHIGFNDDSDSPLNLYFFDTTDNTWRAPMRGMWRTAVNFTTGDYIIWGNRMYVAASTGTSGATAPVHTSGTVSDGGVSWTYVKAAGVANFKATSVLGLNSDLPKFALPNTKTQISREVSVWNGAPIRWLNSSNVQQFEQVVDAGTSDFYTRNIVNGEYIRMNGAGGIDINGVVTMTNPIVGTQAAADNSTKAASTAYVTSAVALTKLEAELTKTANYTITTADLDGSGRLVLYADATSGAITITLPTVANLSGRVVTIIKTDASANVVTVQGVTQNINGAATYTITPQYNSAEFRARTGGQYYAR
jgi:hypothetical protein